MDIEKKLKIKKATQKFLYDYLARFVVVPATKKLWHLNVAGLENVPAEGPRMFIAKHRKNHDSLYIQTALFDKKIYALHPMRPFYLPVRREWNKLMKKACLENLTIANSSLGLKFPTQFLSFWGGVTIYRPKDARKVDKPYRKKIVNCGKKQNEEHRNLLRQNLSSGGDICVFPEATIYPNTMGRFEPSFFELAAFSQPHYVPVGIEYIEINGFGRTQVYVRFGEPRKNNRDLNALVNACQEDVRKLSNL